MAAEKIRIEGLGKIFPSKQGEVQALRNVALSIPDGQFCCIVGPSGCGKTTLLRILAGLEVQTSGVLSLHHRDPQKSLSSMVAAPCSTWVRC